MSIYVQTKFYYDNYLKTMLDGAANDENLQEKLLCWCNKLRKNKTDNTYRKFISRYSFKHVLDELCNSANNKYHYIAIFIALIEYAYLNNILQTEDYFHLYPIAEEKYKICTERDVENNHVRPHPN